MGIYYILSLLKALPFIYKFGGNSFNKEYIPDETGALKFKDYKPQKYSGLVIAYLKKILLKYMMTYIGYL